MLNTCKTETTHTGITSSYTQFYSSVFNYSNDYIELYTYISFLSTNEHITPNTTMVTLLIEVHRHQLYNRDTSPVLLKDK